jgi:hypothetical protein
VKYKKSLKLLISGTISGEIKLWDVSLQFNLLELRTINNHFDQVKKNIKDKHNFHKWKFKNICIGWKRRFYKPVQC